VSTGSSSPEGRALPDSTDWGTRALLRAVNEQVTRIGASADGHIEVDYVCECADSTCFTSIRLPRTEYARITGTAGWFVVADGHGMPEEHVIKDGPGYLVVTRESG
jgi:hypothetical protein